MEESKPTGHKSKWTVRRVTVHLHSHRPKRRTYQDMGTERAAGNRIPVVTTLCGEMMPRQHVSRYDRAPNGVDICPKCASAV